MWYKGGCDVGGCGTREGVMGWMWYKGGCDVGGCATREGAMWMDVLQGRE